MNDSLSLTPIDQSENNHENSGYMLRRNLSDFTHENNHTSDLNYAPE